MYKSLGPKLIFVAVLVALAAWTLYPPGKTLKPGIDLAGGTSLIYEIDTQGLQEGEKQDLAQRMIRVLRRRIDPANIQNLIWRPQGNTRFEIQMPLASAETRIQRQEYEKALRSLLAENVSPVRILRCLDVPAEQRAEDFEKFAHGSEERMELLQHLAEIHDQLEPLQEERDKLDAELKSLEEKISAAGLDLERIKPRVSDWADVNEPQIKEAVKAFLGTENHVELVIEYVKTLARWRDVLDRLTNPETGLNVKYEEAKRQLDTLNLAAEQINYVLELPEGSTERKEKTEQLKTDFPGRADKIDKVVAAFDQYRPHRGRLDDPKDLQRMLKGAGILEFRILPTPEQTELTPDEIEAYVQSLTTKGPKYASDNNYVWCEIENIDEWKVPGSIVAPFGDKHYVLASNKPDESVLHSPGKREWKLERAEPTTDRMGRRAIGFTLDEKGGSRFANVTGKNIGRPLCILLDGMAISAPTVESRIRREGVITGSFTQTEVADMVNKLNAGSLPARLIEQPISVKTIGPSIGADNRDQGIKAGFIGLIVVIFCMAVYYTLAGAIADVALLMNILFVLAMMAGLRATFTLPGIAGIILTIGMSVDANVLIFERIREEQQKGSSLQTAIKNGYQRAFRAILDANLTTFITAAILYWVASEEIKGFAIVLMLGIGSSMFTALFVTRVVFDLLASKQIIKNHLFMLRLIHEPKVDWMRARPIFLGLSIVLIVGSLLVFFTRDDSENNKYDIEFTGGTSVQINLKEGVSLSRKEVADRVHQAGGELGIPALEAANIYSIGQAGRSFEITTTATNKTTATVTFAQTAQTTPETVESAASAIKEAEASFDRKLSDLSVEKAGENPASFVISTSQISPSLVRNVLSTAFPDAQISEPEVDEVVNDAIRTAFAGDLEIQQNLEPEITSQEKITQELVNSYPQLGDFLGGVKIDCKIRRAATLDEIDRRIRDLRFKPDTRDLNWYTFQLFGPDLAAVEPNRPVEAFVYISAEEEAGLRELTEEEWTRFIQNETAKVRAAAELETSLPRVTQIDPYVGREQKTRALIAIALSLFAIIAYVWVRFGTARYGLAAIVALVHDVCITLGAVTACTYIAKYGVGEMLLIGDFKIDLAMIAAFLTLIGYSLNDTIVVFDRIRENRRKAQLIPQTITKSINQTISRTILTSFTTFIVVLIMYIFGGENLRGFTFAIAFGILIGTYSSIAIAAPVLLLGAKSSGQKQTKR